MNKKLTDTLIRQSINNFKSNRISLSDNKVTGLGVEVRKNSATFYLRINHQSKTTRMTLGRFPDLSVADARKVAEHKRKQFIQQVHDGILGNSIEMQFDAYYEEHFLPWCQVYRKTYSSHQSMYKNHLKDFFGEMVLSQISSRHIFRFVNELSNKGYSSGFINKTVQHTRSALKRAEELCGAETHTSLYKPFTLLNTSAPRERFLDTTEARRLRDYVEDKHDDPICLLLGFLMYTGARRHEAFTAEWRNIDLERRSWYVPLTKTGKPRYIVLNDRALRIIEHAMRLQRRQYDHRPDWVFVNPRTQLPYRCIFHRWNKIRTQLKLNDMRIHDLRHSFASTLVNNGATLYEVQKLLGHSRSITTERYAHLANHRLKQAASLIDEAYK